LVLSLADKSAATQRDPAALARIKTIYIESTQDAQSDLQKEALTRELTKVGFEIVNVRSQANALLTVFSQIQVVVDGDGSVPNKSIFTYEVALPNKRIVWKYKISMVMRTLANDVNSGAVKMAAKLLKAKEDAVRKGAHQ
jgi:hypothetical protein